MGLTKEKKKKMKKLSGGMKRRVGIAQAMLNNPSVLVLDEPTVGLDPNERIHFRNLISELSKERLVLLSTHIVSDIEYIADEILLMKDGKIEKFGTLETLIDSIQEKVWTVTISKEEVSHYFKAYNVSNVRNVQGGVELRLLSSQKPSENAVLEMATLEDVFLNYFGERGIRSDDEI